MPLYNNKQSQEATSAENAITKSAEHKRRTFHVLSDLKLPRSWEYLNDTWHSVHTTGFALSEVRSCNLIVVNGNINILTKLVTAGALAPSYRKPIVAVDVVLRPPRRGPKSYIRRLVLNKISYFIHYFKDLRGYQKFYGIDSSRSAFVPFKSNLTGRCIPQHQRGDYVLCFGESMRDYHTFFEAMSRLSIPGAITERTADRLKREERNLRIPKNICILKDDNSREAFVQILEGARVVALPIRADNICASGLSTYLDAMFLGKPVVVTEGPGVSDLLSNEAIIVPANDSPTLCRAVERVWEDADLYRRLSHEGSLYAKSLGGEAELYERIKEKVMDWFYSSRLTS